MYKIFNIGNLKYFYVVFIVISLFYIFGCSPSAEEKAAREHEKQNQLYKIAQQRAADSLAWISGHPEEIAKPIREVKIWNGSDLGLPSGTISGGKWFGDNPSDSYLELKLNDGTYTIVKGISIGTYEVVETNDIIK